METHIDTFQSTAPQRITPVEVPGDPRFHALKHGRRAEHILLPGEDVEEFNELLRELYETHRPRTRREIRCVEAVADYEWCTERNGRMRQFYHGKVLALQFGDSAAQPHCDHDPHRWHHSAQDCTREERRLKKLRQETLAELETLKQLRRQNLLSDAMEALEGREVRPVFPRTAPGSQPVERAHADPSPAALASPMPGNPDAPTGMPAGPWETGRCDGSTVSKDWENTKISEQMRGNGSPNAGFVHGAPALADIPSSHQPGNRFGTGNGSGKRRGAAFPVPVPPLHVPPVPPAWAGYTAVSSL